jgi:O-methyltransferase
MFNNIKIQEILVIFKFLYHQYPDVTFFQKLVLVGKFIYISKYIDCRHTNTEMIIIAQSIFMIPAFQKGVIVEAGTYKGGSTVKLSLIAKIVGRQLIIFDSFAGIPFNKEIQSNLFSTETFLISKGAYNGSLNEVRTNIAKLGVPEVCIYKKGWFEKTMPLFNRPVVAIFLDVDLAESEQTCLKYLYPLLISGGVLFSHDGHMNLVVDVYDNNDFWKKQVKSIRPEISGLGTQKLLKIVKP